PLTKVFWKGEFEGKNLFFKKGFPLILFNKLEIPKTKRPTGAIFGATRGSANWERRLAAQLAGDRKFFQGGEAPRVIIKTQETNQLS
ncbi:MAG: hypothetical protein IKS45_02090, partial [Thermoguttaceae bacterium]|nr:hypothetical protein [Thermoguttaceae bacterium]